MLLFDRLLGWFGQKAMRAGAARLAQQSPTAETAGRALAIFEQNQHKSEVFIDTPAGLVRYTRADIDRLRRYARAGVGERVLGQALLGSSVYGYPGGWAQNRLEQVRHFTHWTYAAIDLYCSMVAGLNPSLAYVRSRGARRERRSGLQIGDLRFENVRAALPGAPPQGQSQISNLKSQIRSAKSLHAIKPHEEVEPAGDDHPLLELLRNPNSWDTTWDLFYELILFLRLTGNSYLWVVPNRLGMPCELWVMPSHWVWPRAGQDKLIEFYEIRPFVGQGILRIPAEEIIHFRFKSPLHKIDGYSPLVAAANETDVYESISLSQFYQFKNGSFPMGHLKLGRSYYDPDDRTLERHYAKWRQRFQGEARFGSTLITGDDVEFAPLMVQPKEMAYGESMAMMRDNILALHRVPKELVGLQPTGGDLSWYAPQYAFCRFSLTPLLQMIGQTMTQRLARRYDASLRLWYEDPAPDNPAEVRANVALGLEKGFLSPNEARTYLLGLEAWPNEAADMPWLNPQSVPLPLNQPGTLKDLEAGLSGWERAAGAGKQEGAEGAGIGSAATGPANSEPNRDEASGGWHGARRAKGFRIPSSDTRRKGSYFETCPRDAHGYCLPRGAADENAVPDGRLVWAEPPGGDPSLEPPPGILSAGSFPRAGGEATAQEALGKLPQELANIPKAMFQSIARAWQIIGGSACTVEGVLLLTLPGGQVAGVLLVGIGLDDLTAGWEGTRTVRSQAAISLAKNAGFSKNGQQVLGLVADVGIPLAAGGAAVAGQRLAARTATHLGQASEVTLGGQSQSLGKISRAETADVRALNVTKEEVAGLASGTGSSMGRSVGTSLSIWASDVRSFLASKVSGLNHDLRQVFAKAAGAPHAGNVATAELDIAGPQSLRLSAFSGDTNLPNFAPYVPARNATLAAGRTGRTFLNDVDAEFKILEKTLQLTTRESTGTVYIYTERAICRNCANAVSQFKVLRPSIKVRVSSSADLH